MKDVPTRKIVAKPRTEKAFACYDPAGNLCITTLAMSDSASWKKLLRNWWQLLGDEEDKQEELERRGYRCRMLSLVPEEE